MSYVESKFLVTYVAVQSLCLYCGPYVYMSGLEAFVLFLTDLAESKDVFFVIRYGEYNSAYYLKCQ